MMKASISKSEVLGKVAAPSSKSYTIRGLICAALANGKSEIVAPLASDDTIAAINVLKKVGVNIRKQKTAWKVEGGVFHAPISELFCGDSAATLRFMTAIGAIIPGVCHLTAGPSLSRRPVKVFVPHLHSMPITENFRLLWPMLPGSGREWVSLFMMMTKGVDGTLRLQG